MITKVQSAMEMAANNPDPLISLVMFVSMSILIMIFMMLPVLIKIINRKKMVS